MNHLIPMLDAAEQDPGLLFVILFGLCTVFVGLICIILLIELLTFVCGKLFREKAAPVKNAPAPVKEAAGNVIENRGELIAAICAAAAEELGTDISALRVVSFRKL